MQVWGTLPAPVATATATARKLLGGVIASHKGLAPSDYNPADGTYAAMVPLNGVNSQVRHAPWWLCKGGWAGGTSDVNTAMQKLRVVVRC